MTVLMVFHKILVSAKSVSFDGFPQNPSPFATFSENLRILKHGSLHEKFLLSAKSMSFNGFSQKIRSDEGLTLETSAFKSFTVVIQCLSTRLIKLNFCFFHKSLVSANLMSFHSFSQNPTLLATFLLKI